jgi:DNA topoisomerase-3
MSKALLVAEKPSVMKDIQRAYNKIKSTFPYDIDFGCCAGHLLGLCDASEYKSEWGKPWKKEVLPIIPESWKTKVTNPKFYNALKEQWENNRYDVVINAGDAGREGQLIQHLVYSSLGVNVPILRLWADDTTEKTIIKALNNLKPDTEYQGLTEASYLRLYFDWLAGINFSRATTLSTERNMRVGRVMSSTLALVVIREKEIRNFVPTDFWELEGSFDAGGKKYKGVLLNPNADDSFPTKYAYLFPDKLKDIEAILSTIPYGEITEIEEEDKITRAPALLNLSELQKECAKRYNFTPAKTLSVAQSLYEKHFLSYPRTESRCLTTEQAKTIPGLLEKLKVFTPIAKYIEQAVASGNVQKALHSKKYVDNSKVKDHPALTPTEQIPKTEDLTPDEKLVYLLVICRFLAIFLDECINTHTTVITSLKTENSEFRFKSTGVVEKQRGWKTVMDIVAVKKQTPPDALPPLTQGERVQGSYDILEKQTTPPSRYNNATILDAMETAGKQLTDTELEKVLMDCAGLGTPATRAEIIEKLVKYEYLSRKGNVIYPTDQGIEYVDILSGHNIISPELTAIWEKKLKEVENGTLSSGDFYSAMVKYITAETSSLLNLTPLGRYHKTIGKCPKCNRDFYEYEGFYACSGYFDKNEEGQRVCDFGLPKAFGEKNLTETEAKALISGKATKPKEYKWKNGTTSFTGLVLDKSTFKISFAEKESIGKCPKCGGTIFAGKNGYYCGNWNKKDEAGNPVCNFSVYGTIGKTKVKASDMSQILASGQTKNNVVVTWPSGKQFSGKLKIEEYEPGKYRFAVKPFEKKYLCKCPFCKDGKVYEDMFYYACDHTPSQGGDCKLSIPKKFSNHTFSQKEAVTLIVDGKLPRVSLVNKDGKPVIHGIHLEKDSKYGIIIRRDPWKKK